MRRQHATSALRFGLLLGIGLSRATADVTPALPGDFSAHEIVIQFDGLSPGQAVSANFMGQGVFFGHGLFGADVTNTATNTDGGLVYNPVFVSFLAGPALRVGFDVYTSAAALLGLTVFDPDGNAAGTVDFSVGPLNSFVGVEFGSGISELWISEAGIPGDYWLQNFRYDPLPLSTTPEPSSVALAAAAIAGALWSCRRRRAHGGWRFP